MYTTYNSLHLFRSHCLQDDCIQPWFHTVQSMRSPIFIPCGIMQCWVVHELSIQRSPRHVTSPNHKQTLTNRRSLIYMGVGRIDDHLFIRWSVACSGRRCLPSNNVVAIIHCHENSTYFWLYISMYIKRVRSSELTVPQLDTLEARHYKYLSLKYTHSIVP